MSKQSLRTVVRELSQDNDEPHVIGVYDGNIVISSDPPPPPPEEATNQMQKLERIPVIELSEQGEDEREK